MDYYTPNSDKDKYYKDYVSKIEGEYTEDKSAYLAVELERINEIISKKEDIELDFSNGVATFEEMKAYYKDYNEAQFYRKPVLSDLIKRADYLKEQYEKTEVIGSFMYDTGYVKYAAQGVDWVLLVFLLIFCSRFYLVEHERKSAESPMYTIVQTTGKGRVYLLLKKLLLNMLGVTAVFALFKAIDFICLTRFYDLPKFSYKLFSITRYSAVSADMTILQYTAITLLSSLIGVLLLSLLIFTAALHLKKTLLTYATLCTGIFMPHFIMVTGQKVGNYIDLTRLQDTDRLFLYSINNYSTPVCFLLFFTVILLAVISLMVFSFKRIQKGGKI